MTPLTSRPRTAAYPLRTLEVHLAALVPATGGAPVPMARLKDVLAALGEGAGHAALETTAQGQGPEGETFVTLAGARSLARVAHDATAAARFVSWLGRRLAAPRDDPGTTRWGWQPLRAEMRRRRLTVAVLADQLNALELEGVGPMTRGNLGGAAVGATLPKPETLARLGEAWGVDPEAWFTADVVAAIRKRDARRAKVTTPPLGRPDEEAPPAPPVVPFTPSPVSAVELPAVDLGDGVSLTFDGGVA